MRLRKEARKKQRHNDPENEASYLEDIEELMRQARELTLDQRRAATRLAEIEAQQASLADKLSRRRKGRVEEDEDDEIARLLKEAEGLFADKKLARLEQDEILHTSDSYKDWLDSKISNKKMGIIGEDIDYFLKMAQEIIND